MRSHLCHRYHWKYLIEHPRLQLTKSLILKIPYPDVGHADFSEEEKNGRDGLRPLVYPKLREE